MQGAFKKNNNNVLYLFLDIGCVLFTQSYLTLCNLMDYILLSFFITYRYSQFLSIYSVFYHSEQNKKVERRNFQWKKKEK